MAKFPTPTDAEIRYAQDNPTDGVLEDFEKKYGPGSTFEYLGNGSTVTVAPKTLRRRRKPIAAGG